MTTTTTNSAANEATEAGGLSVETLIICIILLIVSLLVSAVICFILRRGLRHIHEESEAPQQMEEWSVTPKEDDLEAGAQMNVVGWQDWSKTPEVWDPTALSQYVASIQGLVQSCFQEGAAGVRLIGIKPWAVDFELWEWLELHEQKSGEADVREERDLQGLTTGDRMKRRAFPAKALGAYASEAFKQLKEDVKVLLFLSFPVESPFRDATVEGLFQWHYTRRSWVCWDWSSLATALMLCWDLAMNPLYRVPLVLFFYSAFGLGLLIRKILTFASPSAPVSWRMWHNVILCAFFFGRCIICQPLLVLASSPSSSELQALQVEAFSSVIGLGMTNLSMVFMQQMQTVDTLLFCFINGVVFILWIIFVLQMPLTDALHTAYVGSIVITLVCVRQQRDLEELERKSFDHQLLNTRGLLLRGAEQVRRQSTEVEFGFQMTLLERARCVEDLNF